MEVVAPDAIDAPAALLYRRQNFSDIAVVFGDDTNYASVLRAKLLHCPRDFRNNVLARVILDLLDGVQPQAIDVVFPDPIERILHEVVANRTRILVIKIHRISPRRGVMMREVRTELRQVVPFRSEVVVHDIENDSEALRVSSIHQPLQPFWSTVARENRIG